MAPRAPRTPRDRVLDLADEPPHRGCQDGGNGRAFHADFGASSITYSDAIQGFGEAWEVVAEESEAKPALEVGQRYLVITYGSLSDTPSPELLQLLLKHRYLASEG